MIPFLYKISQLASYYNSRPIFISIGDAKSAPNNWNNSPGSKNEVITGKNAFNSNPTAELFVGDTSTTTYVRHLNNGGVEPGSKGFNALCAAYHYLETQDAALGAKLKTYFLDQMRMKIPGTQRLAFQFQRNPSSVQPYTTYRYWDLTWGSAPAGVGAGDQNPFFFLALWLCRLVQVYQAIKGLLSQAEKDEAKSWFLDMAYFYMRQADYICKRWFPGWDSGNLTPGNYPNGYLTSIPYYVRLNGQGVAAHKVTYRMDAWNNRWAKEVLLATYVAYEFDEAPLKAKAKKWFEGYFRFSCFPKLYTQTTGATDGQYTPLGEYYRITSSMHEQGFSYVAVSLSVLSDMALIPAIVEGDTSWLDFTTTDGLAEDKTNGGPKGLESAINTHLAFEAKQVAIYATAAAATNQDPTLQIEGVSAQENKYYCSGMMFEGVNMYYKNAFWTDVAKRNVAGMTPFPAYPSTFGSFRPDTGIYGTTPGRSRYLALLEESTVNPFNTTTPVIPDPPVLTAGTPTASTIPLTWTAVEGATGYTLERSTASNFTPSEVVATLPGNATNWTDSGRPEGTLYYYRIKANVPDGVTAYSNTANATTLVSPPPGGTNVALGKPVTTTSTLVLPAFGPERVTDGEYFKAYFVGTSTTGNLTCTIDLLAQHDITKVRLHTGFVANDKIFNPARAIKVETSSDNTTWTERYSYAYNSLSMREASFTASARYVRITAKTSAGREVSIIRECEVIGTPTAS